METQFVIFKLANEYYGVEIATVESIIKLQAITALPQAPKFIEGVTNLRGAVIPVIDLRNRFDLPKTESTKESRIVVVEIDSMTVGMIVDAVHEVLRVPSEDIEPPSPLVTTVDSTFITGIAKVNERLIIVLDLLKVLSVDEKAKLSKIRAPQAIEAD